MSKSFYVLQHGIKTGAANSFLREIPRTSVSLLQVYRACTDWVRWDMEGRAQYLHALLNAVHIYALPPKFLKNQLLSCPILSKVNPPVANVFFLFFLFFSERLLPARFTLTRPVFTCVSSPQANSCKDFLSKIFQDMTLRKLPPAPNRGTQLIYVAGG